MTQRQFLNVIDRDEAEQKWREAISLDPLGSEERELATALGRVSSERVASPYNVPGFDRSNVDGFAVHGLDTVGAMEDAPIRLTLTGEVITPGLHPESEVAEGFASSIATGAMVPRGADAIVMIEHAEIDGDELIVYESVSAGQRISAAGSDIVSGETVLRKGEQITSRESGVLAAVGIDTVRVFRQPRVAVFSTGDELVPPGGKIEPGQIFDSNSRIVCDSIREAGADPEYRGILPDELGLVKVALSSALENADMVVLSGGTSKGEGDLNYRAVIEICDPGIVVHGVALKPGKPICLAVHQGKPVVILPGFPTSAIFTFHEFVAPVLRAWSGFISERRNHVRAEVPVRINSERGRKEYLLVSLVNGPKGLVAYPMGKGSGSVTTFSRADGFTAIPRNREYLEAGDQVDVTLLGKDVRPADLVFIGSHCVGIDELISLLWNRGFSAKAMYVGSRGGIEAVNRGECDLAGVHMYDPDSGSYNRPFLNEDVTVIGGYSRMQGIVFRTDDDRFTGKSIDEIRGAVESPDIRMINRNRGSGTRARIDEFLHDVQPNGWNSTARSHTAVAAAVAQERADWGVAIEPAARALGLGFRQLVEERYDLAVPTSHLDRPVFATIQEILDSEEYQALLQTYGFVP